MGTTKKTNNTLSVTTNTTINTSAQTLPIEIALKIDENGMTTLSALYNYSPQWRKY